MRGVERVGMIAVLSDVKHMRCCSASDPAREAAIECRHRDLEPAEACTSMSVSISFLQRFSAPLGSHALTFSPLARRLPRAALNAAASHGMDWLF